MIFVPLLHHANRIVRWISSEGLVPFRPNEPEHPEVNYQHIPIRALYQLQLMVEHIKTKPLNIDAEVYLYQSNQDPIVDPTSVEKLNQIVIATDKSVVTIDAGRHGVVYENLDDIQQKICATIQ